MPSRRRFLAACATGAIGALAGCVDPDVAMSVDPVDSDAGIATRATDDPSRGDHESLVADAVDGGTEVVDRRAPYRPERPVRYDDAVYVLEWEVVDARRRTEYEIELEIREDAEPADATAFEDLPEVDREALSRTQRMLSDMAENDHEFDERQTVGAQQYYEDDDLERSELVPEPRHDRIAIEGYVFDVRTSETEVTVEVFRYEATERAGSLAEFGAEVRAAHLFELDGLSDAESEFFRDLAESGDSYVEGSPDEEFEGVADRLVEEPAIVVRGSEAQWLVEFEGDEYWVRVDFVRMEEYADRLEEADGPVTDYESTAD